MFAKEVAHESMSIAEAFLPSASSFDNIDSQQHKCMVIKISWEIKTFV